ncbi:hypothetical protein J6590_104338 [Homalodisca vitripennis]|nr:hypothetical protein J6590_104338 [Homalodisca vitripennis]
MLLDPDTNNVVLLDPDTYNVVLLVPDTYNVVLLDPDTYNVLLLDPDTYNVVSLFEVSSNHSLDTFAPPHTCVECGPELCSVVFTVSFSSAGSIPLCRVSLYCKPFEMNPLSPSAIEPPSLSSLR